MVSALKDSTDKSIAVWKGTRSGLADDSSLRNFADEVFQKYLVRLKTWGEYNKILFNRTTPSVADWMKSDVATDLVIKFANCSQASLDVYFKQYQQGKAAALLSISDINTTLNRIKWRGSGESFDKDKLEELLFAFEGKVESLFEDLEAMSDKLARVMKDHQKKSRTFRRRCVEMWSGGLGNETLGSVQCAA